jgi:hypothetical protein
LFIFYWRLVDFLLRQKERFVPLAQRHFFFAVLQFLLFLPLQGLRFFVKRLFKFIAAIYNILLLNIIFIRDWGCGFSTVSIVLFL